jgi:RNA polymerase sigma factor (sigma-70 family)
MTNKAAHQEEFKQLMSELADGSEEAAWRIAKVYTPHILRAVRATLPNSIRSKLDSQDFAQIIWTSLLLKRDNLGGVQSPQELINLLVRVAHNKVVDAYRHYAAYKVRDHRRETSIDGVADRGLVDREMTPSQAAGTREKWQSLLEGLSTRDNTILRLRMDGKTYSEIAAVAGVGITTVRGVLNRIVLQLRDD